MTKTETKQIRIQCNVCDSYMASTPLDKYSTDEADMSKAYPIALKEPVIANRVWQDRYHSHYEINGKHICVYCMRKYETTYRIINGE